jgi:hypothetical protein
MVYLAVFERYYLLLQTDDLLPKRLFLPLQAGESDVLHLSIKPAYEPIRDKRRSLSILRVALGELDSDFLQLQAYAFHLLPEQAYAFHLLPEQAYLLFV